MTDEDWKKTKADDGYIVSSILEFIRAIPDVDDRGTEHTAPCTCGGTIHAMRSTYDGHLHAYCDKCGARLIE